MSEEVRSPLVTTAVHVGVWEHFTSFRKYLKQSSHLRMVPALKCLLLGYLGFIHVIASQYGVDVSFPIHKKLPSDSFAGQRYEKMMSSCYKTYSQRECDETENQRIQMNLDQPPSQHNYTQLGFAKVRAPEATWRPLKEFFDKNIDRQHLERWPRGNTYTNHWDSSTYFISVEDAEDGGSKELKQMIWDGVRPLLEEWVGQKLFETSLYGVRFYTEGSVLATRTTLSLSVCNGFS